jgi:predicted membrane protein
MPQTTVVLTAIEWLTLVAVIGLLFAILKALIGKQAKQLDDRVAKNEFEVDEVKKNYLARFEEVKDAINDSKVNIIKAVGDMRVELVENYVTKTECHYREHAEV